MLIKIKSVSKTILQSYTGALVLEERTDGIYP